MRHVIAFDIGGTNMRAAIINEELTIEQVIIESTITGSVDSFLAQIKHLIYRLDYKKYNVEAITFGVPGRVRADGFITALPNIHIENIPLASSIFEEFTFGILRIQCLRFLWQKKLVSRYFLR